MSNKAVKYIRECFKNAHGQLEATMADVTNEQAMWKPAGTAHPISGTYAHLIFSEDMIVQGLMRKTQPLMMGAYAGKTGANKPMPGMGPEWAQYGQWANTVKIDLKQLREYAQAVYKTTDEYVASLVDEDLEKTVDLSGMGMGQKTFAYLFDRFLVGHTDSICGEIAVLKGLQGLKGYPF